MLIIAQKTPDSQAFSEEDFVRVKLDVVVVA
jgi:hypothetical protein